MLFGPSAGLNFLINELVSTSFHSTKIISSFLLVTFNKIAYHSKNLGSKKNTNLKDNVSWEEKEMLYLSRTYITVAIIGPSM